MLAWTVGEQWYHALSQEADLRIPVSQEFCFEHIKFEILIDSQMKIQREQMHILSYHYWASVCFKIIFYIVYLTNLVRGAYT